MGNETCNLEDCLKDMQFLIVDDSGFSRHLIVKELNEMGVENSQIEQSGSGADAISKIESKHYDIFILDIVMAGIDGIDVLKVVKKMQPTAKVIMCSGSNADEIIIELVMLGIDSFVVKPYNSEVFKKAVARTLSCCVNSTDELVVKCHICDRTMIEVDLINTVSFFCTKNCMRIGPIVHALVSQSEFDDEYEKAVQKRNALKSME